MLRAMPVVMRRAVLSLFLFGFGLSGCTPWKVVRQAVPNPFVGETRFHVAPIDYSDLMVQHRTEREFKADRDAEQNQRWDRDKQKVNATYRAETASEVSGIQILDAPAQGVPTVRSRITNMHGGISLGLTSTAARIEMTVQLLKNGQVMDEILIAQETSQSEGVSIGGIATSGYTGSDRLGQTAEKLGEALADYLEERTSPK